VPYRPGGEAHARVVQSGPESEPESEPGGLGDCLVIAAPLCIGEDLSGGPDPHRVWRGPGEVCHRGCLQGLYHVSGSMMQVTGAVPSTSKVMASLPCGTRKSSTGVS
jgi:hypothetical protein